MSTLSVLVGTRRLFNNPNRWTKGAEARDIDGNVLQYATSAKAHRWCLIGAIRNIAAKQNEGRIFDDVEAIRVLSRVIAPNGNPCSSAVTETVSSFNDAEMTRFADVIALLDSAIVTMRGSESWNLNCSAEPCLNA